MEENNIKKSKKDVVYEIFDFMAAWLEQAARSSSPHTVEAYKYAMNLYVRFLEESLRLEAKDFTWKCFSRENIEKWMKWLTQRGNKPQTVRSTSGRFARRRTCDCPTSASSSGTWRAGRRPGTDTCTARQP